MPKIATKAMVNGHIVFTFVDDTVVTIDPADFPDNIVEHATLHGFTQKLGDSYAQAASLAEAKMKFNAVLDNLMRGDWNRRAMSTGGIWVEALARATGESIEDALIAWNDMDDETKAGVKAHPDVMEAKADIEHERAQAKAAARPKSDVPDLKGLFN